MRKSVTIRNVAREAGVSVGTVSRVLNDHVSVRYEVRVRVLKAIDKIGYRPDAVAQSMRRGSTQTIGCIVREINIPSLAAFVNAATNLLDEEGFTLLLSSSEGREERERELLLRLNSQRSDGVLIGPYTPFTPAFNKFLSGLSMPVVMVDRDQPAWADAIMVDHAGATREATKLLLELGHRDIALLTGNETLYPARERIMGYTEAFKAHGLSVNPAMVCASSFLAEAGFRQTSTLLGAPRMPTAIIAGGIDMLAGVLRAIRVRRLRIPQDIAVIAAGNSDLSELHEPAISVIDWDQGEVGRTAVTLLLERLRGHRQAPARHIVLKSRLIDRDSVRQ